MKFYYSIIIGLLTMMLFFWLFVFLIPTPKLLVTSDLVQITDNDAMQEAKLNDTLKTLALIKDKNTDKILYFEPSLESKKMTAIFLYGALAFGIMFLMIILFHSKTHVIFPMVTSLILVFIACALLWLFTNSISKDIYLDIENVRNSFSDHMNILKFFGVLGFLQVIAIIFGCWYEFPE